MSLDLLTAMMAGAATAARERARAGRAGVERRAAAQTPRAQAFVDALARDGVSVIAECKRRSPSRGVLRADYDPGAIAAAYEAAGAAAISVLTDAGFFDGALEHLSEVRAQVAIPVLRKDFLSDPFQLVEARAAGADAILLIVAGLTDAALRSLLSEADGLGLAALVEVHDRDEVDRALAAGATVIGVNSRNLRTLEVDLALHDAVAGLLPESCVAVAESGLRTGADLTRLRALGYDAFLIGERFMTDVDPGDGLRALLREAGA